MMTKRTFVTIALGALSVVSADYPCLDNPRAGTSMNAHDGSCYGKKMSWSNTGTCPMDWICQDASLSASNSLYCQGEGACQGASLTASNSVECTGKEACSHARKIHASNSVSCSGNKACYGSHITADNSANCEGIQACLNADVHNSVNCNGEQACSDLGNTGTAKLEAWKAVNCNGEESCYGQRISAFIMACNGDTSGTAACKSATGDKISMISFTGGASANDLYGDGIQWNPPAVTSDVGLRYHCDQKDGCGTLVYECDGEGLRDQLATTLEFTSDIDGHANPTAWCQSLKTLCPAKNGFPPCDQPDLWISQEGQDEIWKVVIIVASVLGALLLCCLCACGYFCFHKKKQRTLNTKNANTKATAAPEAPCPV